MSINIATTALMPVSQVIAWFLVLRAPLSFSIWRIAAFYCAWAIYNRFSGNPRELAFISMGTLAAASYHGNRMASLAGTVLVFLNYAGPGVLVFKWSAATLAKKVKGSKTNAGILWAYVFKLYFLSNIILWGTVFYKIWEVQGEELP